MFRTFPTSPLKLLKHIKKRLCPNRQRRFKRGSTLFGMYEAGKAFSCFFIPNFNPCNGGHSACAYYRLVQQRTQGCISENERLEPLSAGYGSL